jgi:hypothetical protein
VAGHTLAADGEDAATARLHEPAREDERADAAGQPPHRVGLLAVFAHHLVVDEAFVHPVDGVVAVQRADGPDQAGKCGAERGRGA